MLTPHRTREHWHIPTPFFDAEGRPISLRLPRPTLCWLVFVVGGINVADAVLTAFHLQHHTALRTAAHCVSVVLAALAAWWVGRIVQGERLARAVTVVSALPALYLPATDTPLLYIGAAAVLTAVGEIGFRLRPRCRCGEERP